MKLITLLTISGLLMNCAGSSLSVADSMTLFSPPLLRLSAGTQIQTLDGCYTPQVDEVWHSDATYQERVREALKP